MKTINNLKHFMFAVLALFCAATLFSCTEWDDFKKYTKDGEIMYTGKMDSVQVLSGKNRVQIKGKFNGDPKIKLTKIYWNDFKDSVEFNIDKGTGPAYFDQTFAVDEGVKNFMIYNFDGSGNRSIRVNAIGKSYGSSYRRKLINRFFTNRTFANNNTTITWEPMDLSLNATFVEIEYVVNGVPMTKTAPVTATSTVLEGFNGTNTPFRYRTFFRPEVTSIDTFATPYRNVQ